MNHVSLNNKNLLRIYKKVVIRRTVYLLNTALVNGMERNIAFIFRSTIYQCVICNNENIKLILISGYIMFLSI